MGEKHQKMCFEEGSLQEWVTGFEQLKVLTLPPSPNFGEEKKLWRGRLDQIL